MRQLQKETHVVFIIDDLSKRYKMLSKKLAVRRLSEVLPYNQVLHQSEFFILSHTSSLLILSSLYTVWRSFDMKGEIMLS